MTLKGEETAEEQLLCELVELRQRTVELEKSYPAQAGRKSVERSDCGLAESADQGYLESCS
ncbi:MAG: hypothetical protein WA130_15945 [Candidatus Methanoperedens sp.]